MGLTQYRPLWGRIFIGKGFKVILNGTFPVFKVKENYLSHVQKLAYLRINGNKQAVKCFDPGGYLPAGNPDWGAAITLLRILDHDDLYKSPR